MGQHLNLGVSDSCKQTDKPDEKPYYAMPLLVCAICLFWIARHELLIAWKETVFLFQRLYLILI